MLILGLTMVSFTTYAGGLLTNTNQHIAFLRYFARQSSTEIDAVHYNPAGLAYLPEGLHISLNGQSAFQTRSILSTFGNDEFPGFAGFGGERTKKFKGEASAPFIPSVFAAYKRGNWVFSSGFAITGGGGKASFDNGLGSFEALVSLVPEQLKAFNPAIDKYSVNSFMEGKQYIYGLQMGATYKINENFAVFGGIRVNYVDNGYYGYIRDVSANIKGGDALYNVSDFLTSTAIELNAAAAALEAKGDVEGAAAYRAKATVATNSAKLTADKELDSNQSGWGVTPIVGIHFRIPKWDFAIKYEMNTKLNVENKTKRDDTGLFKHGVNTPHDIPSLLTFGATYHFLPTLRASVGYHHFFDTHAKMANSKQKHLKQGSNEYLFGAEWDVCEWAQVSGGMQRTRYGLADGYQNDMSFTVSSNSFGFGAGFKLAPKVKLHVAYMYTSYGSYTKEMANYNGTGLPGTDVFSRTNKVFGVGMDYQF